ILKGHNFPRRVNLSHKFDQHVMEIGFSGHKVEELRNAKSDWPNDVLLVQKGETATAGIRVPAIDMRLGFKSQSSAIDEALTAAYRLMPYASILQKRVKKASAGSGTCIRMD